MENIKEIIAKNLTELRRSHKMTQQALAEKLNYTDKAISRWEHAETLPDIETLCRICDIYGVRFEYLLTEDQPEDPGKNPNIKKKNTGSRVVITVMAACTVWFIATLLYASLWSFNQWTVFIWSCPVTCAVLLLCNSFLFGKKIFRILALSFLIWTLLASVYIELLISGGYNIWPLFLVGAPLQSILILIENLGVNIHGKDKSK